MREKEQELDMGGIGGDGDSWEYRDGLVFPGGKGYTFGGVDGKMQRVKRKIWGGSNRGRTGD